MVNNQDLSHCHSRGKGNFFSPCLYETLPKSSPRSRQSKIKLIDQSIALDVITIPI
jgi:hypothetical protein